MASQSPNDRLRLCQWNCRSLSANRDLLRAWLPSSNCHILCLQETWLAPDSDLRFPGFVWYRVDRDSHGGGVAIAVRSDIPSASAPPLPPLPGATVCATVVQLGNSSCLVVTVYVNNQSLNPTSLLRFFTALRPPFLICGDFNGHHPSWDSLPPNKNGRAIASALASYRDINLLNDGSATMTFCVRRSAPDLTFVSPDLVAGHSWAVGEDFHSDHFPIVISVLVPHPFRIVHADVTAGTSPGLTGRPLRETWIRTRGHPLPTLTCLPMISLCVFSRRPSITFPFVNPHASRHVAVRGGLNGVRTRKRLGTVFGGFGNVTLPPFPGLLTAERWRFSVG